MGYPVLCGICNKDWVNGDLLDGELELVVRPPFEGRNPRVMLAGVNPTTPYKPAVRCAFALDNDDFPIYRYIVMDILHECGLEIDTLYATNLIKCTFPDDREPRRICSEKLGNGDDATVKNFLAPFFKHCRGHFDSEMQEIAPDIVISFGNIAHQLLVDEYGLDNQGVARHIESVFGNVYEVSLHEVKVRYLPCVYQKLLCDPHMKEQFPKFIGTLREQAISRGIID